MNMRVAALHRLPFGASRFAKDLESVADHEEGLRAELEKQYRENWENAWIVVVEYPVGEKLDFSQFAHPQPGPSAQAAWLEQELGPVEAGLRSAFFMHYVDPAKPLWYGRRRLAFPLESDAPDSLVRMLEYCSPD